ncbi:hypothetical protein [Pelodictyon luteolum]
MASPLSHSDHFGNRASSSASVSRTRSAAQRSTETVAGTPVMRSLLID